MNGTAQDDGDPFYWDPQRLARELCSSSQPWFSTNPRRFPTLEVLSQSLHGSGVDGEVFLTWDSLAFLQELFSDIGITQAHHRLSLHKAIKILKQRSPAYQRWKVENAGDFANGPNGPTPGTTAAALANPPTDSGPLWLQASNGVTYASPGTDVTNGPSGNDVGVAVDVRLEKLNPASQQIAENTDPSQARPDLADEPIIGGADDGPTDESSLQPPAKKRRVAPALVSSDSVVRSGLFHVPTEADAIESRLSRPQRQRQRPLNRNRATAYMGPDALRYEDILSDQPGIESAAVNAGYLGHKKRVNRVMKALLSGNQRRLKTMVDTFHIPIDPDSLLADLAKLGNNTGAYSSDDDSVLAPYGEESGDDEVDAQTRREIDDEKMEVQREANRSRELSKEEINEEIDDTINEFVSDWQDRKLPILERKAHGIWTKAREDRSLKHKIRYSTDFLAHLKVRIAKIRREILDGFWTKPQAVRAQSRILEQSVFDQEHHSWLIDTLIGPMPAKPLPVRRPPKAKRDLRLDEDDEVLTSDPDDDLDGFIVEDDPGDIEDDSDDDMPDIGYSAAAATTAGQGFVKADPSPEPESELRGYDVIDLTFDSPEPETPSRPTRSPRQAESSDDDFADSEAEVVPDELDGETKAGPAKPRRAVPDLVWQSIPTDIELCDDERRLVERFWIIGEAAREEVHDAAKACADEFTFWDAHIMTGLEPDTPLRTTSAMIARLFLYFAQPHTKFAEAVFNKVRRKNRHKVLDKKDCVGRFLTLILRAIPAFPATVELGDLPGGEEGENSLVVVDRRALHLRQQDQERIAAQERRRAELREKIALYESIPKDASRIIVNETKEEDEGLIYIRGEPARLVKDHQIDGVRFLWNRVIANRDVVRHGCVLAHSMGLGKTMQVITFLLAVNHASKSADESVRSQVPEDLRESRTLVLCPASLSQNWRDEMLQWDNQQELGSVYLAASSQKHMSAAQNKAFREDDIRKWAEGGGVLILGYELFVSFTSNEAELADLIATKAAIVIADEAHTIKNPFSKRRRACAKVSTPARIALTGSPLANNVTEYYSMVDWVAPEYMGSLEEFTRVYATPIQKGLYKDPDLMTKRRAYVCLRAVRESMAPKVHRCGNSILREELQQKQEFMFFLPLTDIQRKIYDAYVDNVGPVGQTNLWAALGNLTLVCMHPQCFKKKLDAVLQGNNAASGPTTNGGTPKKIGPNSKYSDDITLSSGVAERIDQLMTSIISDISDLQLSWRFKLLIAILDECRALGDRVLIFSRRTITLDFLEKVLQQQGRSTLRLDGDTPMLTRLGMIKRFNSKDSSAEIFLISTKAGGVGLNIHGANRVIIMDFAHNPMDEQQAIGRAYRIGQEKPVFVYWFVSWGTHEAKLQSRLVYKKQLADRVVEGKDYIPWATEDNFETWVQNVWDTSPHRPLPPSEAGTLGGVDKVVDRLISDPELSKGIESIVTTDTFEVEEDPEDIKLTEVENESVSQLLREAQRRHEDPMDSPLPPSPPGAMEHAGATSLAAGTLVEPAAAPGSMPPVRTVPVMSTVAVGSIPPVPGSSSKPGTTLDSMPPLPSYMDVLHMKSEVQSRMTAFSDAQAEKFVKSVCRELTEKGEQWALKRWRLIIQYLTHHRFKAAVSHQRFSASFLAHSEEPAFVRQIMALETMTPDKFGRFIIDKPPEKHDDPEHLSMALRRHNMGGRSPMRRKEDVIAMREIADRRKQRQAQMEQQRQERIRAEQERLEQQRFGSSPLPVWANNAIRKNQG